ncbi:hypothetical protein FRACYDRAFT_252167 [Fragilariopsis cylindrus CCMP1102]|uniref:Uncharacterized protein n=1 Tax=Fragilariopsis cylindrus CCMP1102 TaxID=635003 RepID=A0A1E7EMK5_9STRA|nr:hypothetical protein FRACYDRAFT_252167 [Fragilariopsis cylindrus CCMP1102]|eukprot:OEU07064.1 hypothetical protein FRACYDRAFT_252167 [Fragilariopsis cylindrus CCMP1102]
MSNPEDVADQVTILHKILEQDFDPNEGPQVYYKAVQDAKKLLNHQIKPSMKKHSFAMDSTRTLKAVGIADAVKEQVDPNKENQRILAQAIPLQDTTAATIKALTEKINRLESGSGGRGSGGRGHRGYRSFGSNSFLRNNDSGTRVTRRWDSDNYCWTCGYDIKHTGMKCTYFKDPATHKKEVTATNTMGGSTRNLHLRA